MVSVIAGNKLFLLVKRIFSNSNIKKLVMRGKPYPTSKLSTGPQLAIAAFASWKFRKMWVIHLFMNSMKFVIPLYLISERKTPNDAVTPQRQS